MAKVVQNQNGGKIIWDSEDWILGLAPNYNSATTGYEKGNKQLTAATAMNPFRSYGNAYPGFLATNVGNVSVVSEFASKGVVQGTNAYMVTQGAKVHIMDLTNLSTFPLTNAGVWPHTITPTGGSSPIGNDCVIYSAKTGGSTTRSNSLFYSYSSSTIWDVGQFDLSSTFGDSFMSGGGSGLITTPLASPYTTDGKGYPHPLIVGDDDVLYIGDRNFVHAYDGQVNSAATQGKFYPAVLTLPQGWIISSFAKLPTGLMIFVYQNTLGTGTTTGGEYFYRGDARAVLWDYVSLDPTYIYKLNDNYVSEGFSYKGTVGCFTAGFTSDPARAKLCKIQLFNGHVFEPVQSFIGDPPIRGGVEVQGDVIYFNSSGTLHSYGSPLLGVKTGLNKLAKGTGTTSGMFSSFVELAQFMSSGATTGGGCQMLNSGYDTAAVLSTPLVEPNFPPGQHGHVTNVKITYADTTVSANSRALSVVLNAKKPVSTVITSAVTDIATGKTAINRGLDVYAQPLPVFEAIKLILQWDDGNGSTDSPGISMVEVSYENVNI